MAKKKKTQLKPISRGFAVTSVPKKATQEDSKAIAGAGKDQGEQSVEQNNDDEAATSQSDVNAMGSIKAEEQSLQNLIDTLQERTDKEVARLAIEKDRRLSKSLPGLELDLALVGEIIALGREGATAEDNKALDEPEDKVIAKLGITYGTLCRVGFSETRIEECMQSINGTDLEEAFDWVGEYIHSSSLSTPGAPSQQDSTSKVLQGSAPTGISYTEASPTPSGPSRTESPAPEPSKTVLAATNQANIKTLVLSSLEQNSDDSEVDDPIREYVRLKLAHYALTKKKNSTSLLPVSTELSQLRKRIDMVTKDYLFDEEEAEAAYRAELKKTEINALRERLQGFSVSLTDSASTPEPSKKAIKDSRIIPPKPVGASNNILDVDDDDSSTGLLDMLDDLPVAEKVVEGKTILVKDMALPKHWSGRTPKVLLQEAVAKIDRYAAISYKVVSRASRAIRASASITWDGQRSQEWTMIDVACRDESQAEQYIATIALHSLSYPSQATTFLHISPNNPTFFRSLPVVYRDLWDELERVRKESESAMNRALWAKLRAIVMAKLDIEYKVTDKVPKQVSAAGEQAPLRFSSVRPDPSDRLMESIQERQTSLEYQKMLHQRNQLPIAGYRSAILDILEKSQILVLSGETGCGKSTQVPAFILEDQLSKGRPCKIYCTEPRRISAVSLALRVSQELGEAPNAVGTLNSLVGYSIRLESNTSRATRLTFVTNGIALRMLEGGSGQAGQGTAFDEVTHIIIDEVHERTIESDFLLIVLKQLLLQRTDLKVILMSATVDADKIATYFGGCPTLHVPGRTFPVDLRYLEDAIELTGWHIAEDSPYARRFHDKYYQGKNRLEWSEDLALADDVDEQGPLMDVTRLGKRYSPQTTATMNILDERMIPYDLIIRLIEIICFDNPIYLAYSAAILVFMPGLGEIRRLIDMLNDHALLGNDQAFRLYPLHSTLSSESQSAVFEVPPPGVRKIVIATNIAETGITIPDITCVIDTGKHREMRFDEKRQISRLVETFVAKSNATQRRGRAGRVRRGLCFHLFTRQRHDTQMAENPLPEMLRLSLSDLALRIKIMNVTLGSSIEDVLSRALDPPASINVQRAVAMLVEVRALTQAEEITPMGRLLSKLPTDVHLGKFLLIATLLRCLDPALTIAATLNLKSPFVSPLGLEQEADRAKNCFRVENSDFLTIHNAFASWRRASSVSFAFAKKFCRTNFLSYQNLQQIEDLRQQFLGYLIDLSIIHADKTFIHELSRYRYGRNRTRFVEVPQEYDTNSSSTAVLNAALAAGLYPKILSVDLELNQMRTITKNQLVTFHPSSVNHHKKLSEFGVNYLAYFTLMQSKKLYAWETGPIEDIFLVLLCGECEFKLASDTIVVDRKLRFRVQPRTNIALKLLRNQLITLLSHQMRGKAITGSLARWNDIAIRALCKVKEGQGAMVTIK
ncbi:hypothetical protein AMATHDRAFT_134454 [Amanita thiersii Skay4041]|uniref:RNA helicase n=1 Tax=Amanita thiersii Skay4041 TaxID=703135 RepID=A0A2A9P0P5_9AGAR|nr:hypothetical protein AMATHDRAFT_134454 [Amanita thiersii Skay4041]